MSYEIEFKPHPNASSHSLRGRADEILANIPVVNGKFVYDMPEFIEWLDDNKVHPPGRDDQWYDHNAFLSKYWTKKSGSYSDWSVIFHERAIQFVKELQAQNPQTSGAGGVMEFSEAQKAKLRALDLDTDEDGSLSYDELAAGLGLDQPADAVATELDQYAAYIVDHDDLMKYVAQNKDPDGSTCEWCVLSDMKIGRGRTVEGFNYNMSDDINKVKLAAKGKRHYNLHGKSDGRTLRPIGEPITEETIKRQLEAKELTVDQRKKLMTSRWSDVGINDINKILDGVKLAYKGLYGRDVSDAAIAFHLSTDIEDVNNLITQYNASRKGEQYSISDIRLTGLKEENGQFVIDESYGDADYYKATFPYDFDRASRIISDMEVIDGKWVETDGFYVAADAPGWNNDPMYGPVYEPTEGARKGWSFSASLGWFYKDLEKSPDWIYSENAATWLFPTKQDDGSLFFWAKDQGEDPDGGEWVYPDMNIQSGRFFDFDTGTYMDADQVANGEIFVDPQTGLTTTTPDSGADQLGETLIGTPETYIGDDLVIEGEPYVPNEEDQQTWGNPPVGSDVNDTVNMPSSPNPDPPLLNEDGTALANWYTDAYGAYFSNSEKPNWKFYNGEDYKGWWYIDPNTKWKWNEDTGWMWNDPSINPNWFYSNRTQDWAYAKADAESLSTNWLNQDGSAVVFPDAPPEEDLSNPPEDPDGEVPSRISYDQDGAFYDPDGILTQKRNQLNDIARDLAYEGWDQGLIMGFLKKTEVYKDLMDWATGREDQVAAEGLIDDIVEQVAEVNARKGNIATNLDMFDARGGAMLDPRMTLEEKLAIRTAKPSRPATLEDVENGLATEVGELIRNPDYDPDLSYYFEYEDPETGELVTKAFRPDMPGKQTFMQEQERLIDGSKSLINQQMDDLFKPIGDTGKSKYQTALDKQVDALREKGILAGGEDDPTTEEDESLGLYAREGTNALNYIYGDDEDSQEGKTEDYNEMQKYLRGQKNYLDLMDAKRDLDISSKIRTTLDDLDPVERARDRAMDRVRLARFGGGVVNKNRGGVREQGGLFENQLDPKLDFKDLSKVTGLGDTYTQGELDVSGTNNGLINMPKASESLKENQYFNNINPLKGTTFIQNDQTGSERQRR